MRMTSKVVVSIFSPLASALLRRGVHLTRVTNDGDSLSRGQDRAYSNVRVTAVQTVVCSLLDTVRQALGSSEEVRMSRMCFQPRGAAAGQQGQIAPQIQFPEA